MGWVTAAVLWIALAVVWALPRKELEPSEIYLKNLNVEKLNSLVEARLQRLKEEIAESYESQLRRHHQDLTLLEERTIALQQKEGEQRRTRRAASHEQYWHSYNFDTYRYRELLKIDNITVDQELASLVIDEVIPLSLWNITAIYRSEAKLGYVLAGGVLRPLMLKNSWTKSLRGCYCSQSASQTDMSEGCACCHHGHCQCPSLKDTCVPCTELTLASCEQHKPHPLLLDMAVGFQYYLDYYDSEHALQRVLIAYYGTTLSFYRIDNDGIQLLLSDKGLTTQSFDKPVTHLGYGEMYKDNDGSILKERFLLAFAAGEATHRCYTINTGKAGFIIGVQFWKAKGTEMRSWQVGGRMLVAVLDRESIGIKELIKSPRLPKYEFRDLQSIRVAGAAPIISWASFSMAFENYLVVVTEYRAQLFNLAKNYTQVQDLVPRGGLTAFSAIIPISVPWLRGRVFLLAGQGQQLAAYVWSDSTQSFYLTYSTRLRVHVTDWDISFAVFDSFRREGVVVVQGDTGPVTLRVEASLKEMEDPVVSQIRALQGIVQPLKVEFDRQLRVLDTVRNVLQHSVAGKNVINGDVIILDGIKVIGTLDTDDLKAERVLFESRDSSGHVTHQTYEQDLEGLHSYHTRVATLNNTIASVHRRLNDAVPAEGSSRLITGRKTILSAGVQVEALTVDRLAVGRPLNARGEAVPLDDLLTSLVRYNDTRVITGTKTFSLNISVGNLKADYVDDVPVKDLVTIEGDHTIAATTIFSRLIAQTVNLSPGGTVGGIDLSEEVVTLDGDGTLGTCNFQDGVTVDSLNVISKMVDGVDIKRLSSRALTIFGGTVQGSLIFVNPPQIGILDTKKIMGVNITKFMSTTVFTHKSAVASGRLAIPSVEVRGDVVVDGFINSKKFPGDYIINADQTIDFGSPRFQHVHFGNLDVGPLCRVDGLLPGNMVTLHTPQTITGLKKFARGVYIEGDLDITSKIIDGVNLDELNSSLSSIRSGSWKFDVVFEQLVTAPSVSCAGTLNNLDWPFFMKDVVYDDVPSVVINSTKIFKNGLTIQNATFHSTFNGESFGNLVKLGRGNGRVQVVTGGKIFLNNITFDSLTTRLVAGVDVKQLAEGAVYLNKGGQIVYGVKTFAQTLRVEELVVTGNIVNLDINKMVRKSTDQVFLVPQSLQYANFSDLNVRSIHMAQNHTVNGVEIVSLNRRRVSLTSPGYYSGVLTVEGSVSSLADLTVEKINGYRVNELTSNLVMKDESSVISGSVKFNVLAVEGPVTTQNMTGANGLNISNIGRKAVSLTDDVMMTGGATWDDMVFRRDVAVGGRVSDLDLQQLSHNVVYLDEVSNQIITGKKNFEGGMTVHGNLEAVTINGVDLRTSLLTRHTEQVITARYDFVNVDVKATIHILGLYNNQNLSGFASLGLGSTNVINGNVTLHGEVSAGHLYVAGLFNGVDTAERMADSVSLYESNVTLDRRKIFMANVTFRTLDVKHVNYVNVEEYLKHVVLSNSGIHLDRAVKVEGVVSAPFVTADSVVVEGTVDGVDYNKLVTEAIYLDRNQTISSPLIFIKDITVQGEIKTVLLNNLNLLTQYLTISTAQTLSANLSLGMVSTVQVDVDGRVNSWQLKEEVMATLKAIGGQTMHGSLTLLGRVEVETDVQVKGMVGRDVLLDLSQHAVELHRNTQVEGSLVFKEPVVASSLTSPSAIVNEVNVGAMLTAAWYLDQRTEIDVPIEFQGSVVFEGLLLTNATLDSVSLEHLQHKLIHAVTQYTTIAKNLTTLYKQTCTQIEQVYKQLESAIYEGDYFEALYEDKLPHHRHASEAFYAFNTTFLVVSWNTCETTWYYVEPDTNRLQVKMIDNKFRAHQWLFLGGNAEVVYVAAAASRDAGDCNSTSFVWKVTNTTITKHEPLKPGERLSVLRVNYLVELRVHAAATTVYTLNLTTGKLKRETNAFASLVSARDIYTTTLTRGGKIITFSSRGGSGTLFVDTDVGEVVEVERSIDDSVFLEQGGRVYLLLAVTREDMHKDEFMLELHSVDLATRTLAWESVHRMAAKTRLTVFFVGSRTTGSYMVVALQEGHTPLVFTLVGATLREFASLSTQRVSWMEHVTTPSRLSPYFPDHLLLLGQYNRTYVLTRLVMRGGAVPHRDKICDNNNNHVKFTPLTT